MSEVEEYKKKLEQLRASNPFARNKQRRTEAKLLAMKRTEDKSHHRHFTKGLAVCYAKVFSETHTYTHT